MTALPVGKYDVTFASGGQDWEQGVWRDTMDEFTAAAGFTPRGRVTHILL